MAKRESRLFNFLFTLTGCSLFLLPLVHAWLIYPLGLESPHTSYSALGGILPQSDASGYYGGAYHFLETGTLDAWNTRRPLNAILFAIRLMLSNHNFQIALILQALLCGLSCLLVANCIRKTFGKMAGIFTYLVLFFFAATFLPTTLSEILGLTLGNLAFVLLWRGNYTKHAQWLGFGALFLTIGLNARAGAFFILPLLILWTALQFGRRTAVFVILGIIGGFIFNTMLLHLYSTSNGGATHGNFAPTLFGIVAGGKGWTYAYTLYPELSTFSEALAAKFLYVKSYELFLENPFLLFTGVLKGIWGFIKAIISFFQFKLNGHFLFKAFIRLLGLAALCGGLYRLKKLYPHYRREVGLVSIGLIAMVLSAGGIWVDGGLRVFATTMPFFAAAIGIACSPRLRSPFWQSNRGNSESANTLEWETKVSSSLSVFLLLTGVIGPLLIQSFKTPNADFASLNYQCPENHTTMIVKTLYGAPQLDLTSLTNITLFKSSLQRSILEDKRSFLKILSPNTLNSHPKTTIMALVYDLNTNQPRYILAPVQLFTNHKKIVGLCGAPIAGAETITQIKTFEVLND